MFTNQKENIAKLGLIEGMRVADLGAGTGTYSYFASYRVGLTGKVYAVEVQKDLVKKIEDEKKNWSISNVECIWGDIETLGGTKLSDGSMDAVILSNILFQVHDKLGLIDETKRILKQDGRVLFIDWAESFGGMGPAPEQVVSESKAVELFQKRGFRVVEKIPANDHHYGIIFRHE